MSEHLDYIKTLHSLFENGFMEAYRGANTRKRKKVLPYLQAIHRRWNYATLVENTPLSPANLMESLCRHFGIEPDSYIVPELHTKTKVTGATANVLSYTMDNHPIVKDMQKMLEHCSPGIDLAEEGCFNDAQALEISELLSFVDPHYASFLMEVALQMKLFAKMPSLYVYRVQMTDACREFFKLSNEDALRQIIDATIALTVMGLRNATPMPEHIFTEVFVRNLLTHPMETDAIFAKVFESMGMDLGDLLDMSNMMIPDGEEPPSLEDMGIDMELLSGTFVLGVMLDRFFFTPFGHFLRMIRPMYALPFDFDSEMHEYINVSSDPDEAFVAFFAPCSSYTLTDLGLEAMGVSPTEDNYFNVAENMPFEPMKDSIFAGQEAISVFVEMARHLAPLAHLGPMPNSVYTFRVKSESSPKEWIHLQMPDNGTLQEMYEEIAEIFDINPTGEYSLFHDKTENRFAEYGISKGKRTKKDPAVPLSTLDFDHMSSMILIAYNRGIPFGRTSSTLRFSIERMNVKEPEFQWGYPRVSRMSAEVKAKTEFSLFGDDDFDY